MFYLVVSEKVRLTRRWIGSSQSRLSGSMKSTIPLIVHVDLRKMLKCVDKRVDCGAPYSFHNEISLSLLGRWVARVERGYQGREGLEYMVWNLQ